MNKVTARAIGMLRKRFRNSYLLVLLAFAVLPAACDFEDAASTEPQAEYDALIGTWTATTFVVSRQTRPGHDAVDLVSPGAGGDPSYRVTLRFETDRTGSLEIVHSEGGDAPRIQLDDLSVLSVSAGRLQLAISAAEFDATVSAEYFRPEHGETLTLRLKYPLDLDGDGKREECLIIGIFRKAN